MNGKQTKCESVSELLSTYIDGRVTAAEKQVVEAHVAVCPRCAGELAELRLMVRALAQMPAVRVPRSFAITAEQWKPRASLFYWRAATAALAAVFLVLFAASAYLQATSMSAPASFSTAARPALEVAPPSSLAAPSSPANDAVTGQAKRAAQPADAAPAAPNSGTTAAPAAGAASPAAAPTGPGAAAQQSDQMPPSPLEARGRTDEGQGDASRALLGVEVAAFALFVLSTVAYAVLWRKEGRRT